MARKRHAAEEIVAKLRQVDVLMAGCRRGANDRRDRASSGVIAAVAGP